MRRMLRLLLVAACALPALAQQAAALEPYQMVRSLQLVQDRIAGGDHAALPMQLKLLGMIDARLKQSQPDEFDDARNLRATLIYGMSGGNPATVAAVLDRIEPQEGDKRLARGIAFYLGGELGPAMRTLEDIDPVTLSPDIGAFVALVKGSIISQEDPKTASRLFEWARLLGPGTLVEEAALRRSLTANADIGDVSRFLGAASLYVRRFLRSPYATQFADGLVKGIVRLYTKLDFPTIEQTIAEMSAEHQKVIYLRLARTAAIEGLEELSDFASLKAAGFETGMAGAVDARAVLYASLAAVASDGAGETLKKLQSIDPRKLSPADRQLLEAALSIATNVVSVPQATAEGILPDAAEGAVDDAAPEMAATAQGEPASTDASAQREIAPAQAEPANVTANKQAAEPAPPSESDVLVAETKAKLEEIDKLLEDAK